MKLENTTDHTWKLNWNLLREVTAFAGFDIGLSSQRGRDMNDACVVVAYDDYWRMTSASGKEAGTLLKETIHSQRRFVILSIDACLTKPLPPDYHQRDCECVLNICRDKNLTFQASSYMKALDMISTYEPTAKAKRVYLETHPQSNFPSSSPASVEFLADAWKAITGQKSLPEGFPTDGQDHLIHAASSALVSMCYGRYKSRDVGENEDFLSSVVEHDGVYWLLDIEKLQREGG